MEQEASAPERMSHVSTSSGASPSPYPSDSVVDGAIKKSTLVVDGNDGTDVSCSTGNGVNNDGDDGLVSSEEEFEMAPEKLSDGDDGHSVGDVEFSTLLSEESVMKVAENDVVDEDKVTALKEEVVVEEMDKGLEGIAKEGSAQTNGNGDVGTEVVVEEKGLEGIAMEGSAQTNGNEDVGTEEYNALKGGEVDERKGTEVQGDKKSVEAMGITEVNEKSEVVGGENGEEDSESLEAENDKSVESDGVKFTSEEDAGVEDVSLSGRAVIGNVEGTKYTEVEQLNVPVERSRPMDNSFENSNRDVEELVDTNAVESVAGFKTQAAGVDSNRSIGPVVGNEIAEDYQEISVAEVSKSDTTVTENGKPGLEPEGELAAAAETKQIDSAVEAPISALNSVANDGKDRGDENRTRSFDSIIEPAQTQAVPELAGSKDVQAFVSAVIQKSESEMADELDILESAELEDVTEAEVKLEDEEEEGEDKGLVIDGENDSEIIVTEAAVKLEEEEEEDEGLVTDAENDSEINVTEGELEDEEEEGEDEELFTDEENDSEISEAAKQFLEELEQGSAIGPKSDAEGSHEHSQRIDGQIVTDSDEEVDTEEEGEGKELFDSAALAALLKAATGSGSDGETITVSSRDGSKLFLLDRPAGLGSSLRSVKPAAQHNRSSLFHNLGHTAEGGTDNDLSEEEKKKLENLQQTRVKFLRLVNRLGHSTEESIASQVLFRLALVAGRPSNQQFSLDAAKQTALQLETEGKDLNFSLNILVLGKAGVGKSATINSIFGDDKSKIHAFEPGTASVKEINGTVDGVKIRVIDTPGLVPSGSQQGNNRKILTSVKKFTKKCPPDVVLYVDRLDTQTRDLNDMPLLRSISSIFGSSIWQNAIVTLTHAASAPPDGPSGSPLSYDVFVAQRSRVVQQSIGQAAGDLRMMNPSLTNPVSLVENHSSCRTNSDGQKVLPSGQVWRSQLLLICYSIKILSEASSLSKPQEQFDHKKLFGFRTRSPPLPYLLSWLLQSRAHPKLSTDQGDNVDSDVDLDDLSDSDQEEEEEEYDQLPPFRPLKPPQLAKLTKEQREAYLEEYEYRVKLLQKKQWREELRRMKEMKKGKDGVDGVGSIGEEDDPENGAPDTVAVPLADMVLPPSFDGDNHAYRYRFLEPSSQFLARPVLDTHGWDHDCGYDGVNVEQSLGIMNKFPAAVTVQVTKDKKEFNIHLDSSVSAKHGDNGSSMAGFDIQNVGKQLAYILRGETKFKTFKKSKTTAGFSLTFLGKNVSTGVKVEDEIGLGKRLTLVGSTGTVRSQGNSAYGANLEVRLKDADFPIGQDQSSLGLSLVKWRKDLALGANLQSQFSIGRCSKVAVRAGLNNKMTGQISVRTSSSDQVQIALVALLPIAMSIYKTIRQGGTESYSLY